MTKPTLETFRQVLHLTVPIEHDKTFNDMWRGDEYWDIGKLVWYEETGTYVAKDSAKARATWNKFLSATGAPPYVEDFEGHEKEEFEAYDSYGNWSEGELEFFIRSSEYYNNLPDAPVMVPQSYSKSTFFSLVPDFEKELYSVITAMKDKGFEVGGCILDDGLIPDDMMLPGADVLMLVLPDAFEAHLEQLASARFDTMVYESVDFKNRFPIDFISAEIRTGSRITLGVHSHDNCGTVEQQFAGQNLHNRRIVISAGDKVVIGGCLLNDADISNAQGAGISSQSYIEYSDEKLETGRLKAANAGSSTPWWGRLYDEGDGISFALIPLLLPETRIV
jgi:hypothetical protein